MKHILQVEERSIGRKSITKNLRKSGLIPAIIYGNSEKSIPVSINARDFRASFSTISESAIIELRFPDNSEKSVLIKAYDEDLIRGEIKHLDFYEIQQGKVLRTMIPIHLTGTAEGEKFGGVVENFTHEVEVEALPKNLIEYIELDTSSLQLGDSLYIKDLAQMEGIKYLNPSDQVIVHVGIPRKVVEEEEVTEEEEEEATEEEEKEQ